MTFKKKLSALLAAGAIGLAGGTFGVVTPTAIAQDGNVELINTGANVSLTINKKEGDPVDTGYEDLPGLEGVDFTIERIDGVDLTTNAGWAELAGMTAENIGDNTVGYTTTITTDANGVATIDTASNPNFTVGVYRVTEVQADGYSVAPPFLITLPYSGTDGNWTYAQTVYPKNQNVMPDKTVDDTGATIGTDLVYTVNAPVPAGDLDRFNIVDPLVENLILQSDPAAVVTATGVSFAPEDYTVTYDANTLRVDFTRSGLDKLEAARATDPALQVNVQFNAEVASIPTDGIIANVATVELPNGGTIDTLADASPTNTLFGNLTINKTSSEAADLSGAAFQLYQCTNNNGTWELVGDALSMANAATAADGDAVTEIVTADANTSDTNAVANGYGIPLLSNSGADGAEENTYCVLETEAPEGFVRNPEPQPVSVDTTARTLTANVQNERDSILGQLPATGAWGIVLIFLIGLALLARGLYTSYRDNKAQA